MTRAAAFTEALGGTSRRHDRALRSASPACIAAVLFLAVILAPGCGTGPGGEEGQRKDAPGPASGRTPARVRVTASIAPLASLAMVVGGERVEVLTLVPARASEHTWEPSPRDAARLQEADIFFRVGLGFERWAERLVTARMGSLEIVDASQGVDLIVPGAGDSHTEHGGIPAAAPAGAAPDPHYWLDPLSMRAGVNRLAEALARRDPSAAAAYRERGAKAVADLEALDSELRERTGRFSSKEFIAFHGAWSYFARRYGLSVAGVIEEFPGKEPGPRHIGAIVRLVRERGIRALFAEPQLSPKAAEAIASECGVRVFILDPVGGEGLPGREDYFSLMRYNVGIMEEALH